MEENNRNGKGGGPTVNSGKSLKTVTETQINVSARFDALMAVQEDSTDMRAGKRGEEIKEKGNAGVAGGSTINNRAGRLTGHKKERASGGPSDKARRQSPMTLSPINDGPKLAADENNNTGPESSTLISVKGKEKMGEECTGTRAKATQIAMAKPRMTIAKGNVSYTEQRPQVQSREYHTYHERFRNVTTRAQQSQEQAHRPEPPDKEIGEKRGTEIEDEEGFMEVENETEEEMMVDGGIALTEHAC